MNASLDDFRQSLLEVVTRLRELADRLENAFLMPTSEQERKNVALDVAKRLGEMTDRFVYFHARLNAIIERDRGT